MSRLSTEVANAGYSIAKDYPYPAKNTVNFGKFGDVCMETLTLARAAKLVRMGFKYLEGPKAQKPVAAESKTVEPPKAK